ncbi:MAG: sulfatase-like hydrolase/transferase [Gemmiger sp.]|nr:sulfatase-like hydrolase/transferase [Gemmiger sp.]
MQTNKNVIVFFTDQQRYDTTGVHGNPDGLTPNFDRMALEGTFVQKAFTPQPVCGPARACLQTGQYATTLGNYRNAIPLAQEHKTMAHYFNAAGYDTAYIGKWHLGSTRLAVPRQERGEYADWLGAGALEASSRPYDTVVYDNDDHAVKLPGNRMDALTDAAIRYLDHHQKQPFFLFLSFLEPHFQNSNDSFPAPRSMKPITNPYTPPDLNALHGTAHQHLPGYYAMVNRLDQCLGRVQDALKSLGMEEDTILLFTTDHGCHFKTRNAEYKRSCHESSIRLPMAFTGGPFTGGGTVRELVSLVDVAPTLLDACGIAVPPEMQGNSLMPLLRRQPGAWPQTAFVQISEAEVGRAIRTQRWKYAVAAPDKDPIADPDSDHYRETALYDLEEDPYELDNLVGLPSHRGVSDVLKAKLLARIAEIEGKHPVIENAPERPCGQRRVFAGEENL